MRSRSQVIIIQGMFGFRGVKKIIPTVGILGGENILLLNVAPFHLPLLEVSVLGRKEKRQKQPRTLEDAWAL